MDRVNEYNAIMRGLLYRLADRYGLAETSDVETIVITDDKHGQYMLFDVGWQGHERIERPWIHVHIKNGKFWIEEDWTEESIVSYLLEAGVPHTDIVLAFNPPDMRQYTDFAVA